MGNHKTESMGYSCDFPSFWYWYEKHVMHVCIFFFSRRTIYKLWITQNAFTMIDDQLNERNNQLTEKKNELKKESVGYSCDVPSFSYW